jgi:hypothetical protein
VRIRTVVLAASVVVVTATASAQSDLDRLMADVLARRDDNWKKLQQYTLNEDQTFRLLGPMQMPLFGTRREYVWVPREGFFVRSPLRVDGVAIGDAERRREEDEFLERERRRERRRNQRKGEPGEPAPADAAPPPDIPDVIQQGIEPEFVSSAYFMQFKFEPGRYALVGRERLLDRDVLRIEYYPEQLFGGDERRRERASGDKPSGDQPAESASSRRASERGAQITRQMNKVSLVTIWVEPVEKQILQYDFQNVDADFLPARWLLRLDELRASMRMGQPFPGVWLPASLAFHFRMTLAIGTVEASYDAVYRDHRLAETSVKVVQ